MEVDQKKDSGTRKSHGIHPLDELTHKHPEVLKKSDEPSRISKILQFQMGKILREQNKHLNQGNMNRSNRAEFLGNLGTRFKNIKAYSKKRIRKNYEKISRRGFQIPRKRFLKSRRLRKPRQHFKLTNQ